MSNAIHRALAAQLGDAVTLDPSGLPRVAPASTDALATALGVANEHQWRIRIEGNGTWMPADAPADLTVTTRRLDRITSIASADLVATVQSGVAIGTLAQSLAAHKAWLALDPPGAPERSIGSVLATATPGPARYRFGTVRDHVLGTTVVTGDGRVVRAGGSVVKNVAGYDLTKLQIGGFGAFGVIADVNLRLRALPAARLLLTATGALDPLFHAGRALVDAAIDATTIELLSPGATNRADWMLIVELAGTEAGVDAELARAAALAPVLRPSPEAQAGVTNALAQAFLEGAISLRAGALPPSLPALADAVESQLGPGRMSLGVGGGGFRWAGNTAVPDLLEFRRSLAEQEIPLTIERAPWPIRSAVGHFGAFREGVGTLTTRLRAVFDPSNILTAPLEGQRDG